MLLLSLLLIVQDPVPAAAHPTPASSQAIQSIRAACVKLSEAKSYTAQQTIQEEGNGASAAPAASAPPAAAPPVHESVVFTAHVQKGKPTHFIQDKLEAWRDGEIFVYRTADGVWERLNHQPAGDPKANPDAVNMRSRMNLARTQVAHEMLAGLDTKIATAAETKEGGKTLISGSFTPEGAAGLGQRFSKGDQGGKDGAQTVDASGTFRCVIAADGNLESMTFDVQAKGGAKDAPVDRKRHVELRVSAVGSTTMEIPAEVKAKVAEKADKPAEKPEVKPTDKP